jgi:hypothetical protein
MVFTGKTETWWNKLLAEKNLLWFDTTRHDTTRQGGGREGDGYKQATTVMMPSSSRK